MRELNTNTIKEVNGGFADPNWPPKRKTRRRPRWGWEFGRRPRSNDKWRDIRMW